MGSSSVATNGAMRRVLVVAIAAVSLTGAVACRGGGSANGDATGTPDGPTATASPHPQPTIEGSTFNFPGRGYASVIPTGWHANPNSLLVGPQAVDTFFSADTVEGVQSNISVSCEGNPADVATDQFVQNKLVTLNTLGAKDLKQLGSATVAGVQAQKVAYTLTRGATQIAKVDVMFATPKCGWVIASASAPSLASQNAAILEQFLQSFRLLADGTSQSGA